MSTYYIKLTFKGRHFDIGITPVDNNGYDIEVRVKGSLSGDDFRALRKYLDSEGYFETANEFTRNQQ